MALGSKLSRIYLMTFILFVLFLAISFFMLLLKKSLHMFKSWAMLTIIVAFALYSIITGTMIFIKGGGKKKNNVRTMKIRKNSNDLKQFFNGNKIKMPKISLRKNMFKTIQVNKFKNEEEKINAKIKKLEQEAKLKKLESKKKKQEEKEKQKIQRKKRREFNEMFRKVKRKYKELPEDSKKRKQMEKAIAEAIQIKNDSFTVSQVMETIVKLFSNQMKNGTRIEVLEEIMELIAEDSSIEKTETKDRINYYKIN